MNKNEIDIFVKDWKNISLPKILELLKQIDDKDYFIECIINSPIYLSSGLILHINDTYFTKKCVKKNKELKLYAPDILILIKSLGQAYIIECLENWEDLGLNNVIKVDLIKAINNLQIAKKYLENADELNLSEKEKKDLSYILKLREQPSVKKFKKFNLPEQMTVGIEIESEGNASRIIEEYFHFGEWKAKEDVTLRRGVEVVSPILSSTDKDAEELYTVLEWIQSLDQTTSERCGAHIHIGADYLTSKQAYLIFQMIWCNLENVLYAICNETGTVPRETVLKYAPPMSPKMEKAIETGVINLEDEESLDKFIGELKTIQDRRYSGINFLNIKDGINTIEFRIANGTLNPDLWVDNVNLFGGILAISQEIAESKDNIKLEKLLKLQDDIEDKEKLNILLELMQVAEEDKVRYISRYETNSKLMKNDSHSQALTSATTAKLKIDLKKLIKRASTIIQEEIMNEFLNEGVKSKGSETNEKGH